MITTSSTVKSMARGKTAETLRTLPAHEPGRKKPSVMKTMEERNFFMASLAAAALPSPEMIGLTALKRWPVSLAFLSDTRNMAAKGMTMMAESHFANGPMEEMPRMFRTTTNTREAARVA